MNFEADDAKLIQDCLAGDQAAWTALVEKYQRLVYSIPFKYQLPPEEAADVFQGVWIDLYRSLASLQNLRQIAQSFCKDDLYFGL